MKKILCLVAMGSLAACGSSGSSGSKFKDPKNVSFEYTTPTAVAGGNEGTAAGLGLVTLAATAAPSTGNLGNDLAQGLLGVATPLAMGLTVFEKLPVASFAQMPMLQAPEFPAILKIIPGAAAAKEDQSIKANVSCSLNVDGKTTSVSLSGCNASVAVTDTDYAVNGSASLNGKYARGDGTVIWGFDLGVTYDEKDGVNTNDDALYAEFKGNLLADGAAFTGWAQGGIDVSTATGTDKPADAWNFKVAVADRVDYDLKYGNYNTSTTPASMCPTTGTITLKRVWTTKPTGTDYTAEETAAFVDHSLQITLTGGGATTCYTGADYAYDTVTAALP